MTTKRGRNRFQPSDVVRLMERAGWSARSDNGHIVLNKADHSTITFGKQGPLRDATVLQLKKAIGVHLDDIVTRRKGTKLTRDEIRTRIDMAKQLLGAGFDMTYIARVCGLASLYGYGLDQQQLLKHSLESLTDTLYQAVMRTQGMTVHRADAEGKALRAPREFVGAGKNGHAPSELDFGALLDLLQELDQKVAQAVGPGHLSLLGTYRERLSQTQLDARSLQRNLVGALEVCDRMVARLDQAVA